MAQYIDKDALKAEIERRLKELSQLGKASYEIGLYDAYKIVLSFLDTLEVKEVDLDIELDSWRHNHFHGRRDNEASGEYLERVSQLDLAKYFFELGLSVSNKTLKGELYETD